VATAMEVQTLERELSRTTLLWAGIGGGAAGVVALIGYVAARAGFGWAPAVSLALAIAVLVPATWRFAVGRALSPKLIEFGEELQKLHDERTRVRKANDDLGKWVASAVGELRELSERVVRIQETERGRMARDLHDSVGQALTALQVDLELMQSQINNHEGLVLLGRAVSACQDAMSDLRRVVYDLRPPELVENANVAEVLRSYAERFELRTGVPTSFRAVGGIIRSDEISTCLLRVLQEALTNVSRHAFAREVGINLQIRPSEVTLEVTDDGQGFDREKASGRGLRGIAERCAFLGGTVNVDSKLNEGTRLTIHLPLERQVS
jgi:signal transduction histidine kinase